MHGPHTVGERGIVLTRPSHVGKATALMRFAKEVEARAAKRNLLYREQGHVPVAYYNPDGEEPVLSCVVSPLRRLIRRATRLQRRIESATVFSLTVHPSSTRSTCRRGEPCGPRAFLNGTTTARSTVSRRRSRAVNRPRQVLANCVMSSVKSRTMSADRVGRRSAIASR